MALANATTNQETDMSDGDMIYIGKEDFTNTPQRSPFYQRKSDSQVGDRGAIRLINVDWNVPGQGWVRAYVGKHTSIKELATEVARITAIPVSELGLENEAGVLFPEDSTRQNILQAGMRLSWTGKEPWVKVTDRRRTAATALV